ncbi:hypothetical protein ULMS_27990 [Patiriisocius marinistellae]|uniref:Uncharacterized protein n=2 Tax=Patiriisocius marinistellae TaxID=2494560 RepID=A0A5J4G468_9FLAO|nr:hypothetical protein ULMS_27990 [Patiriisocius marinistellae]
MFPLGLLSQVGINTDNPQADLDVNGSMRIGKRVMENIQAKKLLGVDENGMIIELELDDNIYIDGNKVRSDSRRSGIYRLPLINLSSLHDTGGIVWPGGTGEDRTVIRIENLSGDLLMTGIDMSVFSTLMDAHGYTMSLYNVSGELTLKSEDSNSLNQNQFILGDGNDVSLKQYEMVKIMYDAFLERWVVMSKH